MDTSVSLPPRSCPPATHLVSHSLTHTAIAGKAVVGQMNAALQAAVRQGSLSTALPASLLAQMALAFSKVDASDERSQAFMRLSMLCRCMCCSERLGVLLQCVAVCCTVLHCVALRDLVSCSETLRSPLCGI